KCEYSRGERDDGVAVRCRSSLRLQLPSLSLQLEGGSRLRRRLFSLHHRVGSEGGVSGHAAQRGRPASRSVAAHQRSRALFLCEGGGTFREVGNPTSSPNTPMDKKLPVTTVNR